MNSLISFLKIESPVILVISIAISIFIWSHVKKGMHSQTIVHTKYGILVEKDRDVYNNIRGEDNGCSCKSE